VTSPQREDLVRQARELRRRIDRLNADLVAAYAERRELMLTMDQVMTRRASAAVWGLSNVAVTHTVNRDRFGRASASPPTEGES